MLTTFLKTVTTLLCAAVLTVFFSAPIQAADSSLTNLESGMSELVYRLSRSIVTVESSCRVPAQPTAGKGDDMVRKLVSTGVIYDSVGHVLVSAPMVIGQEYIAVRIGNEAVRAEVVAIDYHTNTALLHCARPIGEPATLSAKQSCAGHMVVALGNAYGLRAAPALGFCAGARQDGLLQFSVPITSGAIGGGVFDMGGRLLGLIIGAVGSENRIALAVPAHRLPEIATLLLSGEDRHSGFLGVQSTEIEIVPPLEISSPNRFASIGQGQTSVIEHGMVVTKIVPRSPAAQAGLALGDLIIAYNGKPVSTATELAQIVQSSLPGSNGRIDVVRQNHVLSFDVTIGRKDISSTTGSTRDVVENIAETSLVDSLTTELTRLRQQIDQIEARVERLR